MGRERGDTCKWPAQTNVQVANDKNALNNQQSKAEHAFVI